MMRHVLTLLGAVIVSLAVSGNAQAECWTDFWRRVNLDCQRMKCWPAPFVSASRQAVRTPFLTMMDNGWRSQNTLGDHFFNPETQQLTRAGELKLRWIVTEAPVPRRTVFVLKGQNPEATATRVDGVQQAVTRILPEGPLPPVLLTDIAPRGGSGDYFDHIDQTYRSSIPAPRLPEMTSEGEN